MDDLIKQASLRAHMAGVNYAKAKTEGFAAKFQDCLNDSIQPGGTIEKQSERAEHKYYFFACKGIFDEALYDDDNNYRRFLDKEYTKLVGEVCKQNNIQCQIVDANRNYRGVSPYQVQIYPYSGELSWFQKIRQYL